MKKAFLSIIFTLLILLCGACSLNSPVIPQDIEKASLIFVAPQNCDYSSEGIPAAQIFSQVIENADNNSLLPYEIDVIIIDESLGEERITNSLKYHLKNETVLGVCGFWYADNAAAAAQICVNEQIPLLIWAANREDLTSKESYPYILRLCPTARAETAMLCQYLCEEKTFQNWAVITDDSKYGLANQESALQTLENQNCNVIYKNCLSSQTTDFSAVVKEIKTKSPDMVYFGGDPQNLLAFLKELKASDTDILTAAASASSLAYDELLEGVFTVNYDFEQYSDFYTNYYLNQDFDCEMGIMTPLAYEAANLFISTLEKCGTAPNGYLIANTMASNEYNGSFGDIAFDDYGEATNHNLLSVMHMQDKHWVK